MSRTQKIIEAEANLQAAKMIQSIENLKVAMLDVTSRRSSYRNEIKQMEQTMQSIMNLMKAVDVFERHCGQGSDFKLVTDMIDGIKLKSKYEKDIIDLNQKLNIARTAYKQIQSANTNLRSIIVKILELNENDKKQIMSEVKQYSLDDVIDRLFVEKPTCEKDSEYPF